ncbi:hypothetical protein LguiB_005890 [Lonicera macranthoides]
MHFRFPEAPRHSFEQGWDYEGSQRKGSIYKGRERRFKLEFKSYIFKINNGGTTATIVEEIRKQRYSVCIDFGGINWSINDLKAAKQQYDNKRFFSKFQAFYALFLLQRYNNSNGSFISLARLHRGVMKHAVSFPSRDKGRGWLKVSEELHHLLFDSGRRPREELRSQQWVKITDHKPQRIEENEGRSTYAEVVVKKQREVVNKIGNAEAKFVNDSSIQNSQINNAMSVTGARLNELALGKHDWKKAVICIRQSLWDNWRDIQMVLNAQCHKNYNLSPFQPDKAVFWCDDECEAENLIKKGILEINGGLSFKMQSGDQAQAVSTKKLSCTGGWIEISNLPLKWWNMEVFKAIGYECGGLVEIDHKTLNFE